MIAIPQNEENENEDQKFLDTIKNKENIDINQKKNNIRKFIYPIIILIILISSFYIKVNNNKSNLSIIINSFNENNNLNDLINKVLSYHIDNCELIISTNYLFNNKLSEDQIENIKKRNISSKIINYSENTNTVKIRLDSALKSSGDYIIYIDPEEKISLKILNTYKKDIKENNIDIIHFDYDFDHIEKNKIIYQPQIFESLFFYRDDFNFNHFHILGKIYKREIITKAALNLNKIYLNQSNKYFDEMLIVSLIFKEANTFIKLRQDNYCNRDKCQLNLFKKYNYDKKILKDAILFIRFLFEHTGKDKVQEKRMAVKVFKDLLIEKKVKMFYNNELIELIMDTIELYLNCELINDIDKKDILNYKKSIRK